MGNDSTSFYVSQTLLDLLSDKQPVLNFLQSGVLRELFEYLFNDFFDSIHGDHLTALRIRCVMTRQSSWETAVRRGPKDSCRFMTPPARKVLA